LDLVLPGQGKVSTFFFSDAVINFTALEWLNLFQNSLGGIENVARIVVLCGLHSQSATHPVNWFVIATSNIYKFFAPFT
jgi:hypothetical protein